MGFKVWDLGCRVWSFNHPPRGKCDGPASHLCAKCGTPLRPRKVAQGQRHMQAETKPTSLTLHISLLEARDLAIGRGSPPVCTEAHKVREGLVDVKQHGEIAEYRIC